MGMTKQLKKKTLGELRTMAQQAGIPGRSRMSKGQLVAALEDSGVAVREVVEPLKAEAETPSAEPAPETAPEPKATTDVTPEAEDDPETIIVHFLEDGFTALGKMWYRGEELIVTTDSDEYSRTLDANGDSWLHLSEMEQADRYEKIMFRRGRWPGRRYEDGFDPEVMEAQDAEALKQIDKQRQRNAPPPGFKQRQRTTTPPGLSPKAVAR